MKCQAGPGVSRAKGSQGGPEAIYPAGRLLAPWLLATRSSRLSPETMRLQGQPSQAALLWARDAPQQAVHKMGSKSFASLHADSSEKSNKSSGAGQCWNC